MPKTKDAIAILDHLTGDDRELQEMIAQETTNAQVAATICQVRAKARLTQEQLAALVGTTQPIIARLEQGDYQGDPVSMLHRIATAVNRRVEIRLVGTKSSRNRARRLSR